MSAPQPRFKQTTQGARAFNSVSVELDGRFMLPSKEEHRCKIVEMSSDEMLLSTDVRPRVGDAIVVYIAELGRFEGTVDRIEAAGFVLAMSLTALKHKKLSEQLVWFANRDALDLPDNRRNRRFVPLNQWTMVQFDDGKQRIAKINDISASGVNVEASLSVMNAALSVGATLVVGSKTAHVLRVFEGGFVAKFDAPFAEGEIDESVRL